MPDTVDIHREEQSWTDKPYIRLYGNNDDLIPEPGMP
jgi:hypothetical protein